MGIGRRRRSWSHRLADVLAIAWLCVWAATIAVFVFGVGVTMVRADVAPFSIEDGGTDCGEGLTIAGLDASFDTGAICTVSGCAAASEDPCSTAGADVCLCHHKGAGVWAVAGGAVEQDPVYAGERDAVPNTQLYQSQGAGSAPTGVGIGTAAGEVAAGDHGHPTLDTGPVPDCDDTESQTGDGNCYDPATQGELDDVEAQIGTSGGDVVGPATHGDNVVPVFDGVDSKTLKESQCRVENGVEICPQQQSECDPALGSCGLVATENIAAPPAGSLGVQCAGGTEPGSSCTQNSDCDGGGTCVEEKFLRPSASTGTWESVGPNGTKVICQADDVSGCGGGGVGGPETDPIYSSQRNAILSGRLWQSAGIDTAPAGVAIGSGAGEVAPGDHGHTHAATTGQGPNDHHVPTVDTGPVADCVTATHVQLQDGSCVENVPADSVGKAELAVGDYVDFAIGGTGATKTAAIAGDFVRFSSILPPSMLSNAVRQNFHTNLGTGSITGTADAFQVTTNADSADDAVRFEQAQDLSANGNTRWYNGGTGGTVLANAANNYSLVGNQAGGFSYQKAFATNRAQTCTSACVSLRHAVPVAGTFTLSLRDADSGTNYGNLVTANATETFACDDTISVSMSTGTRYLIHYQNGAVDQPSAQGWAHELECTID